MKKNLAELAFLLDRNGSMAGLESDTIGGFNGLIEKQKQLDGEAAVTTVLFDDGCELIHDRASLQGIRPITEKEYYVRGSTALMDAIGRTIAKLDNAIRHTSEEERPEKVMMVITTDGLENASREYSADRVRRMIQDKKEAGWEFLFLGANIDAVAAASRIGIGADRAATYRSDSLGTSLNYEVIDQTVSCTRESRPIPQDWKKRIEENSARSAKKERG